jgi:hypothetical protein
MNPEGREFEESGMEIIENALGLAFGFGIGSVGVQPTRLFQRLHRVEQHFVDFRRRHLRGGPPNLRFVNVILLVSV